MTLIESLQALAERRDMEGLYTDADIARAAADRIEQLEEALAPFAAIDGVAVPRMQVPPSQDRLWSYHDSRADKTHEITRAHIIEAGRVLRYQNGPSKFVSLFFYAVLAAGGSIRVPWLLMAENPSVKFNQTEALNGDIVLTVRPRLTTPTE